MKVLWKMKIQILLSGRIFFGNRDIIAIEFNALEAALSTSNQRSTRKQHILRSVVL